MSGAIPPLPQYAFMASCLVKAQEQFYFTFTLYNTDFLLSVKFHNFSVFLCAGLDSVTENVPSPTVCDIWKQ
jgi:hypothetical protein